MHIIVLVVEFILGLYLITIYVLYMLLKLSLVISLLTLLNFTLAKSFSYKVSKSVFSNRLS